MSDLISRRALLKKLESMTNDNSEYIRNNSHQFTYKELAYIICNQPTAYDIEKVVAELEELPNREADYYYAHSNDVIDREDAIEIVKRGGVE